MKHAKDCRWIEPLRCQCGLVQHIKYAPADAAREIDRLREQIEKLNANIKKLKAELAAGG